ncbi:hypothetical protein ACVME9_003868 [Bradyrhizobium liaoningense]
MARLADVPVVEADHAEAARRELLAEPIVPMDHLRPEPHDQQQRLGIVIAEDLVADVDAIGADGVGRLMGGHGRGPSCWSLLYRTVSFREEAASATPRPLLAG